MKNWYENMAKGQKVFVYLVSTALVLVYGIGLLPLIDWTLRIKHFKNPI